jgi:hypothetical protein
MSVDLKRASALYNELPQDQRKILRVCRMESELRMIKLEQDRIMERAKKAVAEYQIRFNNIKRDLDRDLADIERENGA